MLLSKMHTAHTRAVMPPLAHLGSRFVENILFYIFDSFAQVAGVRIGELLADVLRTASSVT